MITKRLIIPAFTDVYFHANIYAVMNTGGNPLVVSMVNIKGGVFMLSQRQSTALEGTPCYFNSNYETTITIAYEQLTVTLWDKIRTLQNDC